MFVVILAALAAKVAFLQEFYKDVNDPALGVRSRYSCAILGIYISSRLERSG